jgi:hypothetical protein
LCLSPAATGLASEISMVFHKGHWPRPENVFWHSTATPTALSEARIVEAALWYPPETNSILCDTLAYDSVLQSSCIRFTVWPQGIESRYETNNDRADSRLQSRAYEQILRCRGRIRSKRV